VHPETLPQTIQEGTIKSNEGDLYMMRNTALGMSYCAGFFGVVRESTAYRKSYVYKSYRCAQGIQGDIVVIQRKWGEEGPEKKEPNDMKGPKKKRQEKMGVHYFKLLHVNKAFEVSNMLIHKKAR
jgi:hypothetical protein